MCTQISSMLMHWETLSHTSRPLIISNPTAWGERRGGGLAAHVPAITISSHPAAEKQTRAHRQESSHLVPACISYTNVITGGNSLFSTRTECSLSKLLESDFQPEQNSKEHLADPSTLKPKCPERNWIICNVIKSNRFWNCPTCTSWSFSLLAWSVLTLF